MFLVSWTIRLKLSPDILPMVLENPWKFQPEWLNPLGGVRPWTTGFALPQIPIPGPLALDKIGERTDLLTQNWRVRFVPPPSSKKFSNYIVMICIGQSRFLIQVWKKIHFLKYPLTRETGHFFKILYLKFLAELEPWLETTEPAPTNLAVHSSLAFLNALQLYTFHCRSL